MNKRIAATLVIAVLLCTALASLLLAEGGGAPFGITLHDPPAHEVGVALAANVQATFDDDVNAGTVTNDTFVVHGHLGGLASGTFGYDAGTRTVTLDPGRPFHAGEVLRVSATSGIASTGGAGLTAYGWQFTAGGVYSRSVEGFAAIGAGLTGVDDSSAAWGDVDNDGDLDILLTGWTGSARVSKVYRNDGVPGFTDIGAGLTGVSDGSVAWGDVDNDGDLDILLTGDTGTSRVSSLYRNDGGGAFSQISAGLTGVSYSSVAWGDYDNDGDLDIVLTGLDDSWNLLSKVYRNDGSGSFTDIGAALTPVYEGSVGWGDADNDGDLDILLTGCSGPDCSSIVSKVYRNDGASGFTDSGAALTAVGYSSVAWGDVDNDGDLDILLTGYDGTVLVSKVYRNDGSFSFTDIGAGLTPVKFGSVAWGDVDNDGDLDILLTGSIGTGYVSKVYRNDGGSLFTDIAAGLTGVAFSSVAWGDCDNDGDLDILLTGDGVSKVYRNKSRLQIIDHQPETHEVGVPLAATVQATFDADVNAATVTTGTFVLHGHLGGLASGVLSYDAGSRTVTLDPGRAFHAGEVLRVSATSGISNMDAVPLTPYGWQFTAGPVRSRRFAGFVDIGAGLSAVWDGSVAWGDYDNDGDLDILLTGATGNYPNYNPVSKVYRNDGASGFTDINAGLPGVYQSSAAWGDYDNDGDLDILLTGDDDTNFVSKVYRNDGGAFSDIGAALTPVIMSSVAWGDVDNDGDLDILLTGYADSVTYVSKVYRNDTPSGFTDVGAGLTGVFNGSAAWGDYDNDGDLDIVLTGSTLGRVSKVYRNDGAYSFTDIGAGLMDVWGSSVAWGDYDNDGDLDILLAGRHGGMEVVSKVYRNDGAGVFTDVAAGLRGVENASVAWGDYDNDGDLDILLTGSWPVSKVYRNDGGALGFTDIGAGLTGVTDGSVAWGDVDNDGDLDILLTGTTSEYSPYNPVSRLYRNSDAPSLGNVTPASGSGPVGATTYFTTTWSDADGWENLKQCYFHIGDSPSLAGNVTLLYNAAKDKLWLLDDAGTAWEGGCQPGAAITVFNSQATLDCSQTAVRGVGDTLGVRWAIEFKPGFEGTKKLGLKCKDRDKAKAKGKWKGTWTITP